MSSAWHRFARLAAHNGNSKTACCVFLVRSCLVGCVCASLMACASPDKRWIGSQAQGKDLVVLVQVSEEANLSMPGLVPLLTSQKGTSSGSDWAVRSWIEADALDLLRRSHGNRSVRVAQPPPDSRSPVPVPLDPEREIVLQIQAATGMDRVFDVPPHVAGVGVRQRGWVGRQESATHVLLIAFVVDPIERRVLPSVRSESFQRLPFTAMTEDMKMLPRSEALVQETVRVQLRTVLADLFMQLGLIDGVPDARRP